MSLEDRADKQVASPAPEATIKLRKSFDNFRDITYQNLPCWYELSWDATKPAILLRIHNDFIKNALVMTESTRLVSFLSKELGFKSFNGDYRSNIGFEEALKHQGEKDDFTEYALNIPQIKKPTDRDCLWCHGSGEDSFGNEHCLMCSGSGKDHDMDWQAAFAASASLTAFSKLLKFCNEDTSAKVPQLLTIETITERGMHGGSLGVEISFPLRQWLTQRAGYNSIPEPLQAMMTAYDRMFGLSDFDKYSFKIMAHDDGGLIMDCPGNACGIHPDGHSKREGRGYELSCHNVDSPAQQLTLISGLAALHDRARKETI